MDSTTLFHSVEREFVARYNRTQRAVFGVRRTARTASDQQRFCRDDDGYTCSVRIDIPVFPDETWSYRVAVDGRDCWVAILTPKHGPHTDTIAAYQNRDSLISADDVRRWLREIRRMTPIKGCASNVARPPAGSAPEEFIAALARQNVQRSKPGTPVSAKCKALGKEEIALAPDSWGYSCRVSMANGRQWDDIIRCFDEPPYEDFGSCAEDDDYPRAPPRPLPMS